MAKVVHIYVEGDGDVKFIPDYISHIKPDLTAKINKEKPKTAYIHQAGTSVAIVHSLTGWTDIKNMKTDISRLKEEGNDVVVIFDADTVKNEGGFAERKKQIKDYELALDDIFLFPNNKDDGELETLLENIINERNKPIFKCWERYETCLKECASKKIFTTDVDQLTPPAKKSKIYGYLEALLGDTKKEKDLIKDPNRDYKNTDHWNLGAGYLQPLKEFLERHFKKS